MRLCSTSCLDFFQGWFSETLLQRLSMHYGFQLVGILLSFWFSPLPINVLKIRLSVWCIVTPASTGNGFFCYLKDISVNIFGHFHDVSIMQLKIRQQLIRSYSTRVRTKQSRFSRSTTRRYCKTSKVKAARGQKMPSPKKAQVPGMPDVVCPAEEIMSPNQPPDGAKPNLWEQWCSHLRRSLYQKHKLPHPHRRPRAARHPTRRKLNLKGHQDLQPRDQSRSHLHLKHDKR